MTAREWANAESQRLALEIARKTLDGNYDPLLACRELADLMLGLGDIPADVQQTFITIASETDGSLIGPERQHWPARILAEKDAITEKYRRQVRDTVTTALEELVGVLNKQRGDDGA